MTGLFRLDGKIAIVTGAAGSIGKGIARLFVEAGAMVVIADRAGDGASATARSLGSAATAIAFDQSDPRSIAKLVDKTVADFGGLDIMVNCAAAFGFDPIEELDPDKWDRIHAVNLRGVALCCKAAVNAMTQRGGGAIVNISSIAGSRFVLNDGMAYATSKAGGNRLTQMLAREVAGRNIRVNAVIPGAIEVEHPDPANFERPLRGPMMTPGFIPLTGEQGQPADIAAACLYLASDAARYVTGQLLAVDGGISIN